MLELTQCPRTQLHLRCLSICGTHLLKVHYGNLKLDDAVRVLNINFENAMHVFFKPQDSKFRRCRTASQLHDGAWGHSAELRIALQGAADICEVPHMRTSVDVKFIHEAPAAEIAKMNWQRMERDRYLQEATGEEMHK